MAKNMDNTRLLYDAFNIYYDKGIEALKRGSLEVAKRNILASAETLLQLAKESSGVIKEQRYHRAEELFALAEKIEIQQKTVQMNSTASEDLKKFSNNQNNNTGNQDDDLSKFVPVEKTGVSLDDVAGLEDVKREIKSLITDPLSHPDLYKTFKKKLGGGILLYGVPGTGKTMIAQAIANEINAKFYSIKCSDIASKWFGDSEQNVKNLFAEARKNPCSIIFFDEFEALGAKRDSYSTVMKRLVPELLSQIQGFEKSDNILVIIASTNRPWDIDSAFLRPGRFDTHIYVPLPDYKARQAIVEKEISGVPVEPDVDSAEIAQRTDGFNGADMKNYCERLKNFAIARSIEKNAPSPITHDDVEETFKIVKSSVVVSDLEKIGKFEAENK